MTASDRTVEFRQLVKEAAEGIPDAKRRKLNRPSRRSQDGQKDGQDDLNKQYMAEGYIIVRLTHPDDILELTKLQSIFASAAAYIVEQYNNAQSYG